MWCVLLNSIEETIAYNMDVVVDNICMINFDMYEIYRLKSVWCEFEHEIMCI